MNSVHLPNFVICFVFRLSFGRYGKKMRIPCIGDITIVVFKSLTIKLRKGKSQEMGLTHWTS